MNSGQVCEVVNCSKTARLRLDMADLSLMYMRVKRSTNPSYW